MRASAATTFFFLPLFYHASATGFSRLTLFKIIGPPFCRGFMPDFSSLAGR